MPAGYLGHYGGLSPGIQELMERLLRLQVAQAEREFEQSAEPALTAPRMQIPTSTSMMSMMGAPISEIPPERPSTTEPSVGARAFREELPRRDVAGLVQKDIAELEAQKPFSPYYSLAELAEWMTRTPEEKKPDLYKIKHWKKGEYKKTAAGARGELADIGREVGGLRDYIKTSEWRPAAKYEVLASLSSLLSDIERVEGLYKKKEKTK